MHLKASTYINSKTEFFSYKNECTAYTCSEGFKRRVCTYVHSFQLHSKNISLKQPYATVKNVLSLRYQNIKLV